jgi:hypothetical protein
MRSGGEFWLLCPVCDHIGPLASFAIARRPAAAGGGNRLHPEANG